MERMKEYIEKAEIIRAIAAEASHCLTLNKPAEARGYIGAKELIERRKAADVAEVRHGRWILERESQTERRTVSIVPFVTMISTI